MNEKSNSDATLPTTGPAFVLHQTNIPSDQVSELLSKLSEAEDNAPPEKFILSSNRITLDYVSSVVANTSNNLSTGATHLDVVSAIRVDVQLSKYAGNAPPLFLQLENRLSFII